MISKSKNEIIHPEKRAFLAAYAECGSISQAARAAGIGRITHYNWLTADADGTYREAFENARREACEVLETEARRRAVNGLDDPVIYQGKLMGVWVDAQGNVVAENAPGSTLIPLTVKKYSDILLITLLNANLPEKFRHRVDHTGKVDSEHRLSITIDDRRTELLGEIASIRQRIGTRSDSDAADGYEGNGNGQSLPGPPVD